MTMSTYGLTDTANRNPAGQQVRDKFLAENRWPISRIALNALIDLGMSNASIAHYFGVRAEDVVELRRSYKM